MSYPWIIVATHGNLGKALIETGTLIIGEIEKVIYVGLHQEMDPLQFKEVMDESLLKVKGEPIIILTDLKGGTPSNVSALYAKHPSSIILTGVNLGMLLEAEMSRKNIPFDELADYLVQMGRESVQDIGKEIKERMQNV